MKRTKQPASIELAVRLYYSTFELTNSDIKALFGLTGSHSIVRLKKDAQRVMAEKDLLPATAHSINTHAAYEAWGLDINELEERLAKLRELGLEQ